MAGQEGDVARHVVLPAAFPTVLAGFKQAWAFAWHALMAGEFLVIVFPAPLGTRIVNALTQAELDRKSTRLNSSHIPLSRMPSSA